jgi:hypothetical protein
MAIALVADAGECLDSVENINWIQDGTEMLPGQLGCQGETGFCSHLIQMGDWCDLHHQKMKQQVRGVFSKTVLQWRY